MNLSYYFCLRNKNCRLMKRYWKIITSLCIMVGLFQACAKFEPASPGDDEVLDGPVESLTHEQNRRFLAGDVAFNDEIFSTANGLGSIFVATSCGGCHAGDGKGHPFTT